MSKIDCHSGTKKEELLAFVELHKGKKINIHFENNMRSGWGDDSDYTFNTSIEKLYIEAVDTIKTCYIHGIKTVD